MSQSKKSLGEVLEGKAIAHVEHFSEYQEVKIKSIAFTDGSVLDLGGLADDCYLNSIKDKDGNNIEIEGFLNEQY